MKARMFIGTLNNPQDNAEDYLRQWHTQAKAVFVTGQLEKGKEGTVHVQFFLHFATQMRLSALKKHCKQAHFEAVKKDNGAAEYCNKEDTKLEGPWTFGVRPARQDKQGDLARRNKDILEYGVIKAVDDGIIRIEELRKVKQSIDMYNQMKTDLKEVEHNNHWYYGKTGTGKSYTAR